MTVSRDQILGSLIGGALGDILGGVRERGGPSLSDDTQLTLATCEGIAQRGTVEPEAIAAAFLRWYHDPGIVGIGSSTLKAIRDLEAGAHWALSGARGEMAAGNGAAMRIAPLAFVLDPFSTEDRVTIRDVCRITHHSDEAYVGALAVLVAMHLGPAIEDLFEAVAASLPDTRVRDRLLEFAELPPSCDLASVVERYGASGYVVETVPLAMLVAQKMVSAGFRETLTGSAEIDGDADTINAIAGQIAGVELGFRGLPDDLRRMEWLGVVMRVGELFADRFLTDA